MIRSNNKRLHKSDSADYLFNLGLASLIGIFIFLPPIAIVPFGIDKILAIFLILYIFMNQNSAKAMFVALKGRRLLIMLCGLGFSHAIVLVLHIDTVRSIPGGFEYAYFDLQKFAISLPLIFSISIAVTKRYGSIDKLIDILLYCLLIWLSTTFLLILNPEFNRHVLSVLLRLGESKVAFVSNRGFGFTGSHLFTYPVQLSLLFVAIYLVKKNNPGILFILTICAPLLFFAIIFNARIGFLPIFALIFIIVFDFSQKARFLRVLLGVFGIFLGLLIYQSEFLTSLIPGMSVTKEWLLKGYYEITGATLATEATNLSSLTRMWFFPDSTKGFLIGTGINMRTSELRSDLGVINYVFYGGVFFYIMQTLFFLLVFPLKEIWRNKMTLELALVGVFFGIAVTVNFKGPAYTNPGFSTLYFLVVAYVSLRVFERSGYSRNVQLRTQRSSRIR